MSVHTFYRLSAWLPLALPLAVLALVRWIAMPEAGVAREIVFWLLSSLLYGGIPYAVLAIWAMRWIDHRPEAEIRRVARRAPFYMIALYALLMVALGIRIAVTEAELGAAVRIAAGVFALGAVVILLLGHLYVGVVFAARAVVGSRLSSGSAA